MKPHLSLLVALLLAPLAALHAAEPVPIGLTGRTWQGIAGLERTAKGRVLSPVVHGRGRRSPSPENTVVLSYSDDAGKTFSAPRRRGWSLPLSDGTRCYNNPSCCGSIRGAGSGISSTAASRTAPGTVSMLAFATIPGASPPVSGRGFHVGFDRPFSFRLNKATVLSTGEWVLPVVHAVLEPLAGWAGFDPKQVFRAGHLHR